MDAFPRTTLGPPSPVTRVIRLALEVLLRPPTPAGASLPTSLSLIGSLTQSLLNQDTGRSPRVTREFSRIVPPANTLVRWVNE